MQRNNTEWRHLSNVDKLMNVLHHSLAYCILMFFYKFAQLSKKYLFKHRTYKVAEIEMRVAEFKSTRRRKKKSRSPPRENSSESQIPSDELTDFGKSEIIHKPIHYAVIQSFFRW